MKCLGLLLKVWESMLQYANHGHNLSSTKLAIRFPQDKYPQNLGA